MTLQLPAAFWPPCPEKRSRAADEARTMQAASSFEECRRYVPENGGDWHRAFCQSRDAAARLVAVRRPAGVASDARGRGDSCPACSEPFERGIEPFKSVEPYLEKVAQRVAQFARIERALFAAAIQPVHGQHVIGERVTAAGLGTRAQQTVDKNRMGMRRDEPVALLVIRLQLLGQIEAVQLHPLPPPFSLQQVEFAVLWRPER